MIDFILLFYIGVKCNLLNWWFITLLIIKGFASATKWSLFIAGNTKGKN